MRMHMRLHRYILLVFSIDSTGCVVVLMSSPIEGRTMPYRCQGMHKVLTSVHTIDCIVLDNISVLVVDRLHCTPVRVVGLPRRLLHLALSRLLLSIILLGIFVVVLQVLAIDLRHFVMVLCLVHRCHPSRLEMSRRPVAVSLFVVLSMGCHLAVDLYFVSLCPDSVVGLHHVVLLMTMRPVALWPFRFVVVLLVFPTVLVRT